jgi:hypothetical protein
MTFFKKILDKLIGDKTNPGRLFVVAGGYRGIEDLIQETEDDGVILSDPFAGMKIDPDYFVDSKEDITKYFAINERILDVLRHEKFDLEGRDWKLYFSVAWSLGSWPDNTFCMRFPLFDNFVKNTGAKETKFSNNCKYVNTTGWHIPANCLEPIENMSNAEALLDL